MQITSRFTVAIHILTCIDYFKEERRVTSEFLAGSVNANAVIIRNVLSQLRTAGIVSTRQGSGGAAITKPLNEISLYDIYKAVDCVDENGLFGFHANPNTDCPIGRNIHKTMDKHLSVIQNSMENELKNVYLSDIVEDTIKQIQAENG